MTSLPPPQGMSESDYETIEAAVTETVRGRWFLGEFARRNRAAELRQILDAVARLEGSVANGQARLAAPAAPPADPSVRLLMQRIKEIAGQLDTLAGDMQQAGIDTRFVESVEHQAHAVAGMMRMPGRSVSPSGASPPAIPEPRADEPRSALPGAQSPAPRMPRADLPPALARQPVPEAAGNDARTSNPSLAALSALDTLALAQKLALFS